MGTLFADQGIMTLVSVTTIAICAALALYVLYSVVWHGVRRGLREYHKPPAPEPRRPHHIVSKVPDYPPRDWV